MGLIYYRGEEYTEMPPILANAITLTEEEAEKYNISLVDADVQEITLNTGERVFLGAPGSNFVALGINIVQAATEEEFLAKIKPEDAYTYIACPTGMEVDDWVEPERDTVDYIGTTATMSGENITLKVTNIDRGPRITIPRASLYAYGFVLRSSNIQETNSTATLYLIAWTKNDQGKYEVLSSSNNFDSRVSHCYFNHWNPGEYDYACGITGKFSYVTKEEWDEIVAGQGG